MGPEQHELLETIKYESNCLKQIVQADVSFEKMKQAVQRINEALTQLAQTIGDPEEGLQSTSGEQLAYHLRRLSKMLQLKAPRLVLDYEIKWLDVRINHLEQHLAGVPFVLTDEEQQLKDSDLYNL